MRSILASLLLLAASSASAQMTKTGLEGDCGFSKLEPTHISEFAQRAVTSKVTPEYPPAAKANGVTGTVRVRILVNSKGLVEETCPEFVVDQPHPDRSLVTAAEAAALRWAFAPNFGFPTGNGTPRFKYAEDVLIFNFTLDDSKEREPNPVGTH